MGRKARSITDLEAEVAKLRKTADALTADLEAVRAERDALARHRRGLLGNPGYDGDPMLPAVEPDPALRAHRSCAMAASRVCAYCADQLGVLHAVAGSAS